MITSLLVSYYLHNFTLPEKSVPKLDRSSEYVRTIEQGGKLTVEAFESSAGSVPPGASRVEMLKLELSADCTGHVLINTITVQRRGAGANEDITALYVMHRGSRISVARSITQRDGGVDINLRNFILPACTAEELTVLADFSAEASPAGEHRLQLTAVDAGKSTVRIDRKSGSAPKALHTVRGRSRGVLTVGYLRLLNTVRYGTRREVQRFTLTADGTHAHLIHAITFTNDGSARDTDLQNLFVTFQGTIASDIHPSLVDDRVRFKFDPPLLVPENDTVSFGVRADVRASRSQTVRLLIEEESDIEAEAKVGR